jgi:hypothetical protein
MFGCQFKGRLCVLSLDAVKDMARHDISPFVVREIIEYGQDFSDSKMGRGELARCISRKDEVVFVKPVPSYSFSLDEEVWLVKHVGRGKLR